MSDPNDASAADYPFAKRLPCRTCGSTNWAHASLSPIDLRPTKCDRCPEDKKRITIPHASQNIH